MNISINGALYDKNESYISADSVKIENDPQGKLFTMGVKCAPAYLLGDVDADGSITAADARLALRAAVGLENYAKTSSQFLAADVDFDKQLTAGDARSILRAAVGLEAPESWVKA